MTALTVDFCGEIEVLEPGARLTIGREADLVVDADNPFLHRRLAEITYESGLWWIANVGSRLSMTVTGAAGTLQSWVGPGARVPIVLPDVSVLFTAGETTYELVLHQEGAVFDARATANDDQDGLTLGSVELTPSQFRLLLALCEPTLRRSGTGPSTLPSNAAAAERLGWSMTTFNRKLDNVCDKFSRAGVKGLRGSSTQLATNRRARLVEYAVAARVVEPSHLALLDEPTSEVSS